MQCAERSVVLGEAWGGGGGQGLFFKRIFKRKIKYSKFSISFKKLAKNLIYFIIFPKILHHAVFH